MPLLSYADYDRRFSGDESFIPASGQTPALDAGSGLGVIVEGTKPSRL